MSDDSNNEHSSKHEALFRYSKKLERNPEFFRSEQTYYRRVAASILLVILVGAPLGHFVSNIILRFDDPSGVGALIGGVMVALIAYKVLIARPD